MLRLEKVTVKVGNKKIVNELSLKVKKDELFVLIGENGSGKSVIL